MTKLPRGIRQRGDSFFVDVSLQGRRRTGTASSLKEAKDLQVSLKADLLRGTAEAPKASTGWTLQQAYDRTLAMVWDGTRGEHTAKSNAQFALVYFGADTLCDDVTPDELDKWVMHLKKHLNNSPGTINRKLAVVGKMLTVAQERGGMKARPKLPMQKISVGRTRFLTEQEERLILRNTPSGGLEDALVVLIDTGMRLGELLRLTFADVGDGTITIWETKGDLPRTIPMTTRVAEVMRRRFLAVSYVLGTPLRALVFTCNDQWLWSEFKKVRDALKMPDVCLHTMRHTCASRLVQRGVSLAVVQKWMGHKQITVTMRYAHLSPTSLTEACAVLEAGHTP